mgnify:CR=1 FL=1
MSGLLMVTKDAAMFNNFKPVADALCKKNVQFSVVAEGVSMKMWQDAGYQIYGGLPQGGTYDPNTLIRHDINPEYVLEELRPQCVFVGLSRPLSLEEKFALAVENHNSFPGAKRIYLGYIEDLWAAHMRTRANLDFICALDKFGAEHVRKLRPSTKVFITGTPSTDFLVQIQPNSAVGSMVGEFSHAVLLLGQDESTTPMIEGLLAALESRGDYILIPRFHPKRLLVSEATIAAERDQQKREEAQKLLTNFNYWRGLLSGVKRGCVLWVGMEVATMHELMLSSHVVVSTSSTTTLRDAAILNRVAVWWYSDLGVESLKKESRGEVDRYPLVNEGCIVEVATPQEYLDSVPAYGSEKYRKIQEVQRRKLGGGGATEKVVDAIMSYLA